ncbi:VPS10 domain-containing receptor SorCS1 [Goodea atripinnis]|uniref:VPS10 domain-containing receptor SorCS1 n=1 Tax=Goodea atripinnis TaxID=208336 RepID=A0ABV0NU05_9TELE
MKLRLLTPAAKAGITIIMVLTDPEFESSVLISTDEGASYQKYRLSFFVLSLLFHPTEEDWALAYSHDQKVSDTDLRAVWLLLREEMISERRSLYQSCQQLTSEKAVTA